MPILPVHHVVERTASQIDSLKSSTHLHDVPAKAPRVDSVWTLGQFLVIKTVPQEHGLL